MTQPIISTFNGTNIMITVLNDEAYWGPRLLDYIKDVLALEKVRDPLNKIPEVKCFDLSDLLEDPGNEHQFVIHIYFDEYEDLDPIAQEVEDYSSGGPHWLSESDYNEEVYATYTNNSIMILITACR